MQDFLDAILFAFNKLTNRYIVKLSMLSGAAIYLFWSLIGYLFWGDFVAISSALIEFVPFSFIKSNSATLFSTFLYMQVVLVSFAVIYAFVTNLSKTKQSNSSPKLFVYLLGGSAIGWAFIWLANGALIHQAFEKLFTWLPFETVEKTLANLLAFYLIYSMIIASMTIVASLLSEKYLLHIMHEESYYGNYYENDLKVIKYSLRDTGIFLLLSLLAFPFLFIPFLNIVIQILLWVWLAKDTLAYDSAALLYDKPTKETLKEHQTAIWGISMIGATFNFIPVLNIFGAYFSELTMFYYLRETRGR